MRKTSLRITAAILLCAAPALAIAYERSPYWDWVCSVSPGFCEMWGI